MNQIHSSCSCVTVRDTSTIDIRHGNAPQISFVVRTISAKQLTEAGFVFVLHKVVFVVSIVDYCVWSRISLSERDSATGSMPLGA